MTDFTSALGGTFIDPFKDMRRICQGQKPSASSVTATGAVAAGSGVARMASVVTKGTLVDFPLALAEGLRNTPRLYGDEVENHDAITD